MCECATGLTAETVQCSPCSPNTVRSAWLRASDLLRCAPWLGVTRLGLERSDEASRGGGADRKRTNGVSLR